MSGAVDCIANANKARSTKQRTKRQKDDIRTQESKRNCLKPTETAWVDKLQYEMLSAVNKERSKVVRKALRSARARSLLSCVAIRTMNGIVVMQYNDANSGLHINMHLRTRFGTCKCNSAQL